MYIKSAMLCLVILSQLVIVISKRVQVGVTTSQGIITGYVTHSKYGPFVVFTSVPYAKVDENNKFGDALPHPYIKTFQSLNTSLNCPHADGGVIQCLTLNIITPIVKTSSDPYPVLVWFFGGFMMKNSNDYDGRLIAKHGIIVIIVNYRHGPYGWFCLDDIKNQGLKDQKAATKWVKYNIEAFRGDPKKITIGGQSYGGGAVDFHLYSQERYFNKAIIQSGSRFVKGISSVKDNSAPIKIANYFETNINDTKEALQFLNDLDPVHVMKATKKLNLKFGVCKENYKYIGHIKDTPILIGYNSKEDLVTYVAQTDQFYQNLDDIFFEYINENFELESATINWFTTMVKKFYLGSSEFSQDAMSGLTDFSSDIKLNFAIERSVKRYLQFNATNVFKYLFSFTGGSPFKDIRGIGAFHTEELQYLFEKDTDSFSNEQIEMSDRMSELWANFIKFGNPNPLNKFTTGKEVWMPTNREHRYYYILDKEMYLGKHLLHERLAFWEMLRVLYKHITNVSIINQEVETTPNPDEVTSEDVMINTVNEQKRPRNDDVLRGLQMLMI